MPSLGRLLMPAGCPPQPDGPLVRKPGNYSAGTQACVYADQEKKGHVDARLVGGHSLSSLDSRKPGCKNKIAQRLEPHEEGYLPAK